MQACDIREINIVELFNNAAYLFTLHAQEADYDGNIMPDVKKLLDIEAALGTMTLALYNRNIIVGYSLTIIFNNILDSGVKTAQNLGIFVHEAHRSGGAGLALIRATELLAKKRGAAAILFSSPIKSTLCNILPRRGYSDTEILYRKSLG